MDEFYQLHQLGKGAYSTVSLVKRRSSTSQTYYALKIISKALVSSPKQAAHIFAERDALNVLSGSFHCSTL